MRAILVLADGTVIHGKGIGAEGEAVGEVVFNTGMTGYSQALTDPSYKGQILMFTYPLIGNYAIPPVFESDEIQPEGVIMRSGCDEPNHWQSNQTISKWLEESGVPGMEDVDTRMLTRKIRVFGVMPGVLVALRRGNASIRRCLKMAREFDIGKLDLVSKVCVKQEKSIDVGGMYRALVIDCGCKESIVRELTSRGVNVTIAPPTITPDRIEEINPDGMVISNGPGDPAVLKHLHRTVSSIMAEYPILAICLGHQILAIAAGGRTYKMKFGHRGANQPVKDLKSGKVYITSQNHGYAVDADSLSGTGFEVTQINANDGTVEGIAHEELPIISVQYHPEASPGPLDSKHLFDSFVRLMKDAKA